MKVHRNTSQAQFMFGVVLASKVFLIRADVREASVSSGQ